MIKNLKISAVLFLFFAKVYPPMKKLILAFAFVPILSFSQNHQANLKKIYDTCKKIYVIPPL